MSDIGPIGRPNAGNFGHNNRIPASYTNGTPTPPALRAGDKVQLSDTARLLSQLNDLPDIRQDLIDRVKAEIANGTYETPEKLDSAISNMLDELG
ncbi:MAG: flagellar biosynthesis anti-sigma factor FlgM [Phycisphaeraceae bacterium]